MANARARSTPLIAVCSTGRRNLHFCAEHGMHSIVQHGWSARRSKRLVSDLSHDAEPAAKTECIRCDRKHGWSRVKTWPTGWS